MNDKVSTKKGKKTKKKSSKVPKPKKTVSAKSPPKAKAPVKKRAAANEHATKTESLKPPPTPSKSPRTTAPPPVPSGRSSESGKKAPPVVPSMKPPVPPQESTEEISLDPDLLENTPPSAPPKPPAPKSVKAPPPPPQKRTFMSQTIPPPPHKEEPHTAPEIDVSVDASKPAPDLLIPIDTDIESPTVPLSKDHFAYSMPLSSPSVAPPPSAPVVSTPSETVVPPPPKREIKQAAPPIDLSPYENREQSRVSQAVIAEDREQLLRSKADQGAGGPEKDIKERATSLIATCEKELERTHEKLRIARLEYDIGATYELFLEDSVSALKHYLQSLEASPLYLPSLRSARRLHLTQKSFPSALKLLDVENRLEAVPKQKAMLLYLKGRILEDVLHQQTKARQCYLQALEIAPGSPEIIDAVTQVELKAKNWSAVESLTEQASNAIQADPIFQSHLVAERARILDTRLGRASDATEVYQTALKLNPDADGVMPQLKRLMYGQARWQELVSLFKKEISDTDDIEVQVTGFIQIARIYSERLGHLEKAITALEQAHSLTPDDTYILEELTRLLEKIDDPQGLIHALTRLAGSTPSLSEQVGILHRIGQIYDKQLQDPTSAAAWHEQALNLNPAYIPSLRALGALYERLEKWDALIHMYLEEAKATPNSQRRADAFVRVAELYEFRLNDPNEAAKHHTEALVLVPTLESSFKSLTRIYSQAKAYPALIKLYTHAVEHAESEDLKFAYWFKIGSLYEDALNDPAAALSIYRKIHKASPKNLGAVHSIQRAAESAGNYREYVDTLKKEAELSGDRKRKVALLQKAAEVTQDKLEEHDAALAGYKKVLDLDENHCPALSGIGRLYNKLGRWPDLLEIYAKELKLSEQKDDKLDLLMKMAELCETHIGDEERASGYYKQAIDIDPTYVPALHALCHNLEKQGDIESLTKIIQKELDGQTDPPVRARVAYRLGEVYENNSAALSNAAEAYAKAVEALPTYRPALDGLTRINGAMKRYQELADGLIKEAESGTNQQLVIEALYQAGVVYNDHLNDSVAAMTAFEKILTLHPRHVPTLLSLVPLYREKGTLKKLSQVYMRLSNAVLDDRVKVGLFKELNRVLSLAGEDGEIPKVLGAILGIEPSDTIALSELEGVAIALKNWDLLADVQGIQIQLSATDPKLQAIYLTRLAQAMETTAPGAAIKAYSDATAFDTDGLSAVRGLQSLAARIKDPDLQIDALQKEAAWTQSDSAAADLLVEAADINIKVNLAIEPAVADLKTALTRCPEHTGATEKVYKVLSGAKQYDLLIDIFSATADAITDRDQKAELYSMVATFYAETKNDLGGAIGALLKMLKSYPKHIPTMMHLVDLYKENHQWEDGVKTLEKVIKQNPNPKVLAEVQLEAATIYSKHLNDMSRATNHVENLLMSDPKNVPALMMLSEIQFKRGKIDDAHTNAGFLLKLAKEPKIRSKALLLAAQIRLKNGAKKAAAQAFREAIALGGPSNSAWAKDYYGLIGKEETWSDYLSALVQYQKSLPTDSKNRQISCAAEIARVQHEGLGKVEDAVATLQHSVKRFGRHSLLCYHLAKRLAGGKRYEEAISEITRIINETPTHGDTWRLLAHVYRGLGEPRKAACALAPLVVLKEATREERAHAKQAFSTAEVGAHPGSFSGQGMWDISPRLPGEDDITLLLQTIEDALAKVYPPDLSVYGLSTTDQLNAESGHPARQLATRLSAVFGVSEYQLFLNPTSKTETLIELTQPVSIILPGHVLNMEEAGQIFFMARIFAYLSKNQHAILKIGSDELKLILAGLTHKHSPAFSGSLDYETLDRIGKRIIKATSWRSRRSVEDAALNLAQKGNINIEACIDGIELAAVRAAAILSGNLNAAVDSIKKSDSHLAKLEGKELLAASPLISDLLTFWVSSNAFTLRRRAGLMS